MVSQDEVVALHDLGGREGVVVAEAVGQVLLADLLAVHGEEAVPDLHRVARQGHHPLDERDRRVAGIPEDHDVAALDGVEAVDELVDDDALAVLEQGQHARPLNAEGLGHERDQEEAEEHRHREVVQQLPNRPPDPDPLLLSGRVRARSEADRLRGDRWGGLDPHGLHAHALRGPPRTTRVPATRSWRPSSATAIIRKPIPRLAVDRR
jgi:hypothetical protein